MLGEGDGAVDGLGLGSTAALGVGNTRGTNCCRATAEFAAGSGLSVSPGKLR